MNSFQVNFNCCSVMLPFVALVEENGDVKTFETTIISRKINKTAEWYWLFLVRQHLWDVANFSLHISPKFKLFVFSHSNPSFLPHPNPMLSVRTHFKRIFKFVQNITLRKRKQVEIKSNYSIIYYTKVYCLNFVLQSTYLNRNLRLRLLIKTKTFFQDALPVI